MLDGDCLSSGFIYGLVDNTEAAACVWLVLYSELMLRRTKDDLRPSSSSTW
jgi:hypothetical protein